MRELPPACPIACWRRCRSLATPPAETMARRRQLKGWTNKLIWGDNKLILSSNYARPPDGLFLTRLVPKANHSRSLISISRVSFDAFSPMRVG